MTRINVYEEELGEGVEIIRKDGINGTETFFGLRIWLKSPQEILDHSTAEDDDRSAVTFWSRSLAVLQALVDEQNYAFHKEGP